MITPGTSLYVNKYKYSRPICISDIIPSLGQVLRIWLTAKEKGVAASLSDLRPETLPARV